MARTTSSTGFTSFGPGFNSLDPTDPDSIDRLLDFHRTTFGNARMEDDDDGDEDEDDAGGNDGNDGNDQPKNFTDSAGKTWDFPANTPVKDMTDAQAAEYWRHKAQKHEKENNNLRRQRPATTHRRSQNAGDDPGAGAGAGDADQVDADQVRQAERDTWAPRLVRSEMKRFLPDSLSDEQVEAIVAPLNTNHFLTSDGEVDTDKVKQYASSVSPRPEFPGTGQGRERGTNSGRGSVSSAKEDYVESRRKKR